MLWTAKSRIGNQLPFVSAQTFRPKMTRKIFQRAMFATGRYIVSGISASMESIS